MTFYMKSLLLSLLLVAAAIHYSGASLTTSSRRNHEKEAQQPSIQVASSVRGARNSDSRTLFRQEQQQERQLMKNDKNNKNGGGANNNNNNNNNNSNNNNDREGNGNGLVEAGFCADFALSGIQDRARSSFSDDACRANSCGGGCCRIYNWLICDTSNSLQNLQCVCNSNTAIRPFSTPAPVLPPVTPQPVGPPPTVMTMTQPPVPVPTQTPPPVPAPTLSSDREDLLANNNNGGGLITVTTAPNPAPQTFPPVPAVVPPTNPLTEEPAVVRPQTTTPAPYPLAPWQQCERGSNYHNSAGATDRCFHAEDCQRKDECCIKSFCLCANPQGMDHMCVPSRFV